MSVPRGAPLRAQLCPYLCPPALSPAGAGRASAPLPWRCRGCRGGSGRSGGPRQPPLIAACRRLSPPSRAPLPGSRGSGALLCRWMPRAPSRSLLPFSLPPSLPPSFPGSPSDPPGAGRGWDGWGCSTCRAGGHGPDPLLFVRSIPGALRSLRRLRLRDRTRPLPLPRCSSPSRSDLSCRVTSRRSHLPHPLLPPPLPYPTLPPHIPLDSLLFQPSAIQR